MRKNKSKKQVRFETLQTIARTYLAKMKTLAKKHRLDGWLNEVINANKRGECVAPKQEVDVLARMVDEERIGRREIPDLIGISYRTMNDNDLYEKVRKLGHVGVYSKNDALLLKAEMENENGGSFVKRDYYWY